MITFHLMPLSYTLTVTCVTRVAPFPASQVDVKRNSRHALLPHSLRLIPSNSKFRPEKNERKAKGILFCPLSSSSRLLRHFLLLFLLARRISQRDMMIMMMVMEVIVSFGSTLVPKNRKEETRKKREARKQV